MFKPETNFLKKIVCLKLASHAEKEIESLWKQLIWKKSICLNLEKKLLTMFKIMKKIFY